MVDVSAYQRGTRQVSMSQEEYEDWVKFKRAHTNVPVTQMGKITTEIDHLFELVKREGEITIEEARKVLGVPYNLVEHWAKELGRAGMVTVHYPVFEPSKRATIKLKK